MLQSFSQFPIPLAAASARRKRHRSIRALPAAAIAGVFASLLAGAAHAAPDCDRTIAVGEQCEIALDVVHPTQSAVGRLQVDERVKKIKDDTDAIKRTRKRVVPIVQAPDGAFYLTDGHHQASVLAQVGEPKLEARVIARFDNPATFWEEMQARHWVYLFDREGNPIAPAALPKRVGDMADDPYRALAGYAESAGYFKKTDAYFMEFQWARYFGSKMKWKPIDRDNLPAVMQSAGKLACQADAESLPGYSGPCPIGQ